jgi:dUTP pyrophosphatase
MFKIKVKLLSESAKIPTRANPTDAGLDLYAAEGVYIRGGGTHQGVVDTGVAIEIPDGYVGLVFPRSSVGAKLNTTLSNSTGVIDSDYRGPIKVVLSNHSNMDVSFLAGDRVAQLVIVPILILDPVEVEQLTETGRGEGGFGSTGR